MTRIAEELAERFFGTEIEGHQDLDGDATAAVIEFVDAHDFAQGFLIDGTGRVGIGKGDEDAEPFFIARVFGDEVDAVLCGILGGKNFVEVGEAGFGRAHADNARKLQTTFAAAFFCSHAGHDPFCAQVQAMSQALNVRKVLGSIGAVQEMGELPRESN